MVVFSSLIRGSLLIGLCTAACSSIGERKAWHTLSNDEKDAYIDAELCLMSLPAKLNLSPARTRFDEFQAIHAFQAWSTHFVGAFLPFHRAMLHAHETALREECGYKGYQPYWQEQLDAGKFTQSVVFSAEHGFGGGGSGTGNCITTGPFANYTNVLGPGYAHQEHCIDRQIADFVSSSCSQRNVDSCLAQTTFEGAWNCIEGSPHFGGHGGVGGEMVNGVSSPGDPVFYLHHTWLDKIWADWQAKDPSTRLTAIGGVNVMSTQSERMFNGGQARPEGVPRPTGADGDPSTVTTLNHVLNMFGNGKNFTIAEVMDTTADPLCFKYVDPA